MDCDVLNDSDTDLKIVIYTAAPGSEDATKLDLARIARVVKSCTRRFRGNARDGDPVQSAWSAPAMVQAAEPQAAGNVISSPPNSSTMQRSLMSPAVVSTRSSGTSLPAPPKAGFRWR